MIKITNKDWTRMVDIVAADKNTNAVTKSLKNKDKAIARFVIGLKLSNVSPIFNENWKEYQCKFSEFGNKALSLGATQEEIQEFFDITEIPTKIIDLLETLKGKKLNNRFVGPISSLILKAGGDIKFLAHNGNALTNEGRYAMEENGCKWTIGYKTEVTFKGETMSFCFDAITDEGDGPTSYYLDNSDKFFDSLTYGRFGIRKFSSILKDLLK